MKRTILLFVIFLIEALFIARFMFMCSKLDDKFYFSSFDVRLMVESDTHNDLEQPALIRKAFHNKVVGTVILGIDHTLSYIDSNFLINSMSFVGFFGFVAGLYYLARLLPRKKVFLIYSSLFVFPLIEEIFRIHILFPLIFFVLISPFVAISFYGSYTYLGNTASYKRYLCVIILIVISLWWLAAFSQEISHYCSLI